MGGTEGFTRAAVPPAHPRRENLFRRDHQAWRHITDGLPRGFAIQMHVWRWLRKIDGAHAYRIAVDVDGEIHWLATVG